jgi:hypothetical protein
MTSRKIQNIITKTKLWTLIKIFPFIFALHELEEWNILSWHRKHQSNIPDVIDLHLRTIFVIIIGVTFLFFFIVQKIKNQKTAAYILFPVLTLFIYNGLAHFYWSIYFTSYAPGLVFGFIVSVPIVSIIIYKMISKKLVSKWYASFVGIIFTAMFAHVIVIGDKLESGIVNAMFLGKIITELIGL